MNIANVLTLSRFGFALLMVWLLCQQSLMGYCLSAVCFILAALTDLYDGYFARKLNLISNFGKIMDPIADKALILAVFITVAWMGVIPMWMVFVIALREVVVTVDRLIVMQKGKVIAAERAGKVKTVLQIVSISFILLLLITQQAFAQHQWFTSIETLSFNAIYLLMGLTMVVTVVSGAMYFRGRMAS